jgi:hypothetical protein
MRHPLGPFAGGGPCEGVVSISKRTGRPSNEMVGAAGIEPATAGLENHRACFVRPYPSVFATSSILPMVHSESFGDDLLRGVGHDFGQHFRRSKQVGVVKAFELLAGPHGSRGSRHNI